MKPNVDSVREIESSFEDIFASVNEAAAKASDQARDDAQDLAENMEKARNAKRSARAAALHKKRKRATVGLIGRLSLSAALAAFIIWTKEARWISPQIMPYELMLVSSFAAYCTGCWVMCMAFWKE